jgi:hypothetical protein
MHSQILLKSTSRRGREATMGEGAASVSFGGPLHRNSVLLRAGESGHDLGSCEGERADRQRHPSFQEAVREGWSPARTAQAGALLYVRIAELRHAPRLVSQSPPSGDLRPESPARGGNPFPL